jgi:hypothetical protein
MKATAHCHIVTDKRIRRTCDRFSADEVRGRMLYV